MFIKGAGTKDVVIIVTYVDDLLVIGDGKAAREAIVGIRQVINMDEPATITKYLGVHHHITRDSNGTTIEYDMRGYFHSAVKTFEEKYGTDLKPTPTPYAPSLPQQDFERLNAQDGIFKQDATSFVMKLMYGARMASPGIITAVSRLSRELSKWTKDSDRKLIRLFSYIKHSLDSVLRGTLNFADADSLKIIAYPDADFNGDEQSTRSTSGFFLEVAGADGRGIPISWGSKRQTFTASHTAEAELVSLSSCLRTEVIPTQLLLQRILGRPIDSYIMEDNAATIVACERGYSPAMRFLKRTQRVSIGLIHDVLNQTPEEGEGRIILQKNCHRLTERRPLYKGYV